MRKRVLNISIKSKLKTSSAFIVRMYEKYMSIFCTGTDYCVAVLCIYLILFVLFFLVVFEFGINMYIKHKKFEVCNFS